MPAKKTILTDEERARRIREAAERLGTDESPEAFERAFGTIVIAHAAKEDTKKKGS
jgi:hypothetical protein